MTAIVGILNKRAIAVAADSAETIGSGIKIYNNANKIFTLSKYNPIGIAIYGNAFFNSCIPWEIIIKSYRNKLKNRSFKTVKEYAEDFMRYLDYYKKEYLKEQDIDNVLIDEIRQFWRNLQLKLNPNQSIQDSINLFKSSPAIASLQKLDKKRFVLKCEPFFKEINENLPSINNQLIKDLTYEFYIKKTQYRHNSGIAFFGYGEDEIYPVLYRLVVYNCFDNKLIWEFQDVNEIKNMNSDSFICPMAQTDVIATYITGISPLIENTFINSTIETIKTTLSNIGLISHSLKGAIDKIDINPIIDKYIEKLRKFKQEKIISPLMLTVATMEKEDLAELAENLIYLTSLKRRITPNLESVGGPIDVAIVSKGDGFIWIKRKHYFDPELNQGYFNNYFDTDK